MPADFWQFVSKLRSMDRHEFADRTRQELAKRTDAVLSLFQSEFASNAISGEPVQPGAFFFTPQEVEIQLDLLRGRLPLQVQQIISRADDICSHRFDLLGFEDLDYGARIDWQLDAVHAKRARAEIFYRVKYLDFDEVGDSKIVWELNRHQHLVTLAKAYRLSGDQRYTRELFSQWKDWQIANPYPCGINWASSLEVAFRSLSWMWIYHLLNGTSPLEPDFRRRWLRTQALNGRHIERYLSTYFSANTHLLGEAVALFFIGTLCPELSGADRWQKLGWKIVLQEAGRQVNADGLHFERSLYYHVYALDLFLHAYVLSLRNQHLLSRELECTIEKMLQAVFVLGSAGPPRFGDDDGGRMFDPARNRSEHLLDPLVAGAILLQRGDFKALGGNLCEEAIWLFGKAGVERWDSIQAKAPTHESKAFEQTGVFVLSTETGSLTVVGCPSLRQSSGHDHADGLSVCLQSGGRAVLIDPGTCEYVPPKRNRFRGTAMHNTLCVDDEDQSEPFGPFSWKNRFDARVERWIVGERFSLFAGSHGGYRRLRSPVVHRRWVVALNIGIFLIRDIAEGAGQHQLDLSWHLAPGLNSQGQNAFSFGDAVGGLAILPVRDHGWQKSIHESTCSPVYGQQVPATVVRFSAKLTLPAEFTTVLVPLHNNRGFSNEVRELENQNSTTSFRAYSYEDDYGEHRFYFGPSIQPWAAGPVSSDAEFVCLSFPIDRAVPDIIFCNGSYVQIEGIAELRAPCKVTCCEFVENRVICAEAQISVIVPAISNS